MTRVCATLLMVALAAELTPADNPSNCSLILAQAPVIEE